MSKKIKGALLHSGEWAKHLRPKMKKQFWGAHRAATRAFIKKIFGIK